MDQENRQQLDEVGPSISRQIDSLQSSNSIQEPHQRPTPKTQFPVYYPTVTSSDPPVIYCRSLMSSGNGFPPWQLTPSTRPEARFQQGPSIGDVGYINHEGGFWYYFNIFYSRNHPIQEIEMPLNFRPIEPPLSDWKIQVSKDHFQPGSIINSEGIAYTHISKQPLDIKFTSSAHEGAVLILPEGATREDLVETHKLFTYVKEHASDWYQFLNGYSDLPGFDPIVNSTLFVVTGTDKTKNWNTACFPPNPSDSVTQTVFHYSDDKSRRMWHGADIEESSEMTCSAEGKYPCALFLRGISVALSKAAWDHGITPIPFNHLPRYYIPSIPAHGRRANFMRFIQSLRRGPSDEELDHREILLAVDPTAEIALVEDSVWCPFMHGRRLILAEFTKLVDRILDKCDIVTTDGVVHFAPKAPAVLTSRQRLSAYFQFLTTWTTRSKKERKALHKLKQILSKPTPTNDSEWVDDSSL